jgi:hypothetical protein
MALSFWISVLVLVGSLAVYGEVLRGWRRLRRLRDVAPIVANAPAVSVIVAARNEERGIEAALRSLLAVDHPNLEIIAVDDRSTDATGAILDRLREEFPRLSAMHVRELPEGWLGKNHALHRGAEKAGGDYLLFTDADVVYEPSAVSRAAAHCDAERLDHLTVFPEMTARTLFLQLNMLGGLVGIFALYRPWRARETARHGMGIGAFNMVRASSYRAVGGHAAIAMEVLDDIELGALMGERRMRQELLLGLGMVAIEMYHGALEFFRGIQKNLFAFLDYSAWKLLAASVVTFAFSIWPWAAILLTSGTTRWLNAASAAIAVGLYVHLAPRFGYRRWCALYLPITGVLTLFLMWQISIRTWLQRGVVWRGTFYPLTALTAAHKNRGLTPGSDPGVRPRGQTPD